MEPGGLFEKMDGTGAHEVIIETPDHSSKFADFSVEHIRDVLWTFRERMVDLKRDSRLCYIIIFKNDGFPAGASLEHSHSQLIALPIVPKMVMEKLDGFNRYLEAKKRCIFCDMIKQEIDLSVRVILKSDMFISLVPFAPRFPFETWILPLNHFAHFEDMPFEHYYELASTFKNIMERLKNKLDNPSYNIILHSCPIVNSEHIDFHWHIEIMPTLTSVAGFERGCGMYINPVSPEDAAKWLR